jgi:hypothetical protein
MASAPAIVAQMLEQLDVQPGHRVLEIGAGTGYNAALLAHLAGPDGDVRTIDIEVYLRLDDRHPSDAEALGRALDHPACHNWLGVNAAERELGHFEFWLATMDGFCHLLAQSDAIEVRPLDLGEPGDVPGDQIADHHTCQTHTERTDEEVLAW